MSTIRKIVLNAFISMAEETIATSKQQLATASEALLTNPTHTLEWGERMFRAAALLDVYEPLLRTATETRDSGGDSTAYFNRIVEGLTKRVITMASSPKRSSSQCSNLMEQERLAVYANLLDMLSAPYMHGLDG